MESLEKFEVSSALTAAVPLPRGAVGGGSSASRQRAASDGKIDKARRHTRKTQQAEAAAVCRRACSAVGDKAVCRSARPDTVRKTWIFFQFFCNN